MTSSDHNESPIVGTDYFHIDKKFQADVSMALQASGSLEEAIRSLYVQGYGKLLICRGLEGKTSLDSTETKRLVIRIINDLIAEQKGK